MQWNPDFSNPQGKKNKFEKLDRKFRKKRAGYSKKRGSTVDYITCILKFQL